MISIDSLDYLSTEDRLLGWSKKHRACDFHDKFLANKSSPCLAIDFEQFFLSLKGSMLSLCKHLKQDNRILIYCPNVLLLEKLQQMYADSDGRIAYVSHKWVNGLYTNPRVRHNIEESFLFGRKKPHKVRKMNRLYSGLKAISQSLPSTVIFMSDNECNSAIKETLQSGAKVIAVRDTTSKLSRSLPNSILMNSKDYLVNLWLLELIENFYWAITKGK